MEVHVGALQVPELFVSGTVAGRDQRIVLSGSGDATAESVAVKLSASEKEAFGKSVAANTELMNIARGFLG